jgi:hypothetical protein
MESKKVRGKLVFSIRYAVFGISSINQNLIRDLYPLVLAVEPKTDERIKHDKDEGSLADPPQPPNHQRLAIIFGTCGNPYWTGLDGGAGEAEDWISLNIQARFQ